LLGDGDGDGDEVGGCVIKEREASAFNV